MNKQVFDENGKALSIADVSTRLGNYIPDSPNWYVVA